ncbi:MAG: metallophosphoesterase family protein [Pseudomonadota bacterium]
MIAIISDIHGNLEALRAVLAAIDDKNIKDVICLGDVAGYYPEVNECCDLLRNRNIPCLMGNHDYYIAAAAACPRSNSANDCLEYQRSVIRQDTLNWISSLKSKASWFEIEVVHGGWVDPLDEYLIPTQEYFDQISGNVFASGHTHVPIVWTGSKKSYCNPGSVGQPRDGNPDASFATWDGRRFENFRVEYDISRTQQKMADAGFEEYYWKNLAHGLSIGKQVNN